MTQFLRNARSELKASSNGGGDGRWAVSRMFQYASPASVLPARRPTRGSGFGGAVDIRVEDPPVEGDTPQATSASDATPLRMARRIRLLIHRAAHWLTEFD